MRGPGVPELNSDGSGGGFYKAACKVLAERGTSNPVHRILLAPAGPNSELRPLCLQARGQFFHAQPLRGVMSGEKQSQAVGLGDQVVVEPELACHEHVCVCADSIDQEFAAGTTDDRHLFYRLLWITDQLESMALKEGLHCLPKLAQVHWPRQPADPALAVKRRFRLERINIVGRLFIRVSPAHGSECLLDGGFRTDRFQTPLA